MTPRKSPEPARAKKPAAKKTGRSTSRTPRRRHSGPQATPADRQATPPSKPEPSKAPKGFIVVDGSNIANSSRQDGKPRLANIQRVHDLLVHEGYEPVIFVDASLRHQIPDSEVKLFSKWEGDAFIVQVPRGVNGDEAVLEFASRHDAPVLSNDNYQDLEARYPWVRDRRRRVPYNLVRGELILYKYEEPQGVEPSPPSAATPPPSTPSPRHQGRQRSAPRAAAPAPEPARPAPEPAAPVSDAPRQDAGDVPAAEKHRNFRKPRPVPVQPTVPRAPHSQQRARPEPLEAPIDHVVSPPPAHRGRNQQIPRATEAEKDELKQTLIKLFDQKVQPGGSIRADQLSEETRRAIPGFRPQYYGSSTFTKLLDRMDDVFELARRGPEGQMASLEGPQNWPIVVLRR